MRSGFGNDRELGGKFADGDVLAAAELGPEDQALLDEEFLERNATASDIEQKARAPIKSAGVVVGRIASIRFDNESYEAIVEMNLDASYQFPRDTTAKILTSGILGEQYVGLEAGGDGVMLKSGDRLRLTQSAVVLENLISQFLFSKASEAKDAGKEPAKEPAK